jgi:hypothetical protein
MYTPASRLKIKRTEYMFRVNTHVIIYLLEKNMHTTAGSEQFMTLLL